MLRAVDGTMLTSGTSEIDHKTGKSTGGICLDMRIHNPIHMVQKRKYLSVLFKEIDDLLVHSGKVLILSVPTGVMDGSAIEYVASAVS